MAKTASSNLQKTERKMKMRKVKYSSRMEEMTGCR